ncbi:hypothetical protein [Teichococcus aestuarii]
MMAPLDPSRPGDVARYLADFGRLLARRAARAAAAEEEARRRGQFSGSQQATDWGQWVRDWLDDLRRIITGAQREGRRLGARDAIAEVRAERAFRAAAATARVPPVHAKRLSARGTPAALCNTRAEAMRRLLAAEDAALGLAARDAARRVTAAAARGDKATLAAAAAGDLDDAREAAEEWHKKHAPPDRPTARRRITNGLKGPRL